MVTKYNENGIKSKIYAGKNLTVNQNIMINTLELK